MLTITPNNSPQTSPQAIQRLPLEQYSLQNNPQINQNGFYNQSQHLGCGCTLVRTISDGITQLVLKAVNWMLNKTGFPTNSPSAQATNQSTGILDKGLEMFSSFLKDSAIGKLLNKVQSFGGKILNAAGGLLKKIF